MKWIKPNWPVPGNVQAFTTTRVGGKSEGPFSGLNLGLHVKDDAKVVESNRQLLREQLNFKYEPAWLEQTHSANVVAVESPLPLNTQDALPIHNCDGSLTRLKDQPCVVLTADCLPLLLCTQDGTQVAAIHCGWRGIARGIIEQAIVQFLKSSPSSVKPHHILAWMGPAMGPTAFEVGSDVFSIFTDNDRESVSAFKETTKTGKWLANIYQLARIRLERLGVSAIYGGEYCTYASPNEFYSFRRDGDTGRMASLIWIS